MSETLFTQLEKMTIYQASRYLRKHFSSEVHVREERKFRAGDFALHRDLGKVVILPKYLRRPFWDDATVPVKSAKNVGFPWGADPSLMTEIKEKKIVQLTLFDDNAMEGGP